MRILWINCRILFPLDTGGKIRTYNILKQLAKNHEIIYLTFSQDLDDRKNILEMEKTVDSLITIPWRESEKFSSKFYLEVIKNLLSKYPYVVKKYFSPNMKNKVNEIVGMENIDLIVCDFLFPTINIPGNIRRPKILFEHNVESTIWERHFKKQSNLLLKLYLFLQLKKLLRYEKETVNKYDHCIVVSELDKERIRNNFGKREVSVVPTGVDTDYFKPTACSKKAYNIVFTGSMDWLPNEDGIIYFVDKIFPIIKKKVPQANLSIVGRNPTEKVKKLEDSYKGVEVTGYVNDIRPFLDRSEIFIVPLRIGGGTRIKIFEAMAMQKPVISTTVGAEGLPVKHYENIIIADDPEVFAEETIRLLQNEHIRDRIGSKGQELVVKNHSWINAAKEFERVIAGYYQY